MVWGSGYAERPTAAQSRRVREKYRYRCARCGLRLGAKGGEIDHIVPRSEGGRSVDENLQLLCCAREKGSDSCHSAKTCEEHKRGQQRRQARGKWERGRPHPGLRQEG